MIRFSLAPGQRVAVGRSTVTFLGKTPWGSRRFLLEQSSGKPGVCEMRDHERQAIPGVPGAFIVAMPRTASRGGRAARIGLELPEKVVATLLPEKRPALQSGSLHCQGLSI